ncbi:MAG: hypothetical protein QM493_00245 [Sulfurovum sp.]
MKEFLISTFGSYAHQIVTIHILSAIVWVGGMIAIYFAVHPTMQTIKEPKLKLGKTLILVGKFFNIVIPFIILSIVSAVFMAVGFGFRASALDSDGIVISEVANTLYNIVHIKEGIWLIMAMNFALMYYKRAKAQKLFDAGDMASAKETVALIPKLLLPINIFLGLLALWFGVTLRGL